MTEITSQAPRTAMVLVTQAKQARAKLEHTAEQMRLRTSSQNAFDCELFVLVVDCSQSERESLAEMLAELAAKSWRAARQIVIPEALSELSSGSRRGQQNQLAEYLADTFIPRIVRRTGTARHVGIVWDPHWLALVVAGSAVSASIDGVSWWDPPGAPDRRLLPDLRLAHELREPTEDGGTEMLGESPAVQQVRQQIQLFAQLPYPVLLIGETGTGKELCARMLHEQSRRKGPLASINGAMLDPELASSELFGHKEGAFTGATRSRKGRMREAEGGTFFLDELSSVPIAAQSKLLRALQDAELGIVSLEPVGAQKPERLETRFVSALQRDPLEHEDIRPDLYFRVAALTISLPPLRERNNDVLLLSEQFLRVMCERHGDGPRSLDDRVQTIFQGYPWPGNVRELSQVVRISWLMANARGATTISQRDLPPRLCAPPAPLPGFQGNTLREQVAHFVVHQVEQALMRHPENKAAAARSLGFDNGQALERYRDSHARSLHATGEQDES